MGRQLGEAERHRELAQEHRSARSSKTPARPRHSRRRTSGTRRSGSRCTRTRRRTTRNSPASGRAPLVAERGQVPDVFGLVRRRGHARAHPTETDPQRRKASAGRPDSPSRDRQGAVGGPARLSTAAHARVSVGAGSRGLVGQVDPPLHVAGLAEADLHRPALDQVIQVGFGERRQEFGRAGDQTDRPRSGESRRNSPWRRRR